VHRMRFAFEPHGPTAANADLIRAATAFNRPPVCVRTNSAASALPGLTMRGGQSVVCTALRKAEHSDDLIIRFFEASGKRRSMTFSLGDGMSSAKEVNFLENPIGRRVKIRRGHASVRFRPYEVKTLLVKCEGLGP
jgi:alpha-mannosidase